jgi:hypothetical protein
LNRLLVLTALVGLGACSPGTEESFLPEEERPSPSSVTDVEQPGPQQFLVRLAPTADTASAASTQSFSSASGSFYQFQFGGYLHYFKAGIQAGLKYTTYYETHRGYAKWNTSSIPDNAVINSARLVLRRASSDISQSVNIDVYDMGSDPEAISDYYTGFTDAGGGNAYGTVSFASYYSDGSVYLNSLFLSNLKSRLPQDWVALGLRNSDEASTAKHTTFDVPILVVEYSMPVPAAPSALTASRCQNAPYSCIALSWVDNSTDETQFYVYRSTSPDDSTFQRVATLAANSQAFVDTGLSSGTTWYYKVIAWNANGYSNWSNKVQLSTLVPPLIKFPAPMVNGYLVGVYYQAVSGGVIYPYATPAAAAQRFCVDQGLPGYVSMTTSYRAGTYTSPQPDGTWGVSGSGTVQFLDVIVCAGDAGVTYQTYWQPYVNGYRVGRSSSSTVPAPEIAKQFCIREGRLAGYTGYTDNYPIGTSYSSWDGGSWFTSGGSSILLYEQISCASR